MKVEAEGVKDKENDVEEVESQKDSVFEMTDFDLKEMLPERRRKISGIQSEKDLNEMRRLDKDFNGHIQGFLPDKRDLYRFLRLDDLNRHGQRDKFMSLDEVSAEITLPIDENLLQVDFADLFTKIEMRATIKIRLMFFQWFENLVQNTLHVK